MINNAVRNLALEKGGTLVFLLKMFFGLAVAGLAISDKNTTFLKNNPGLVVGEAFVVGIGSAIALAIVCANRRFAPIFASFRESSVVRNCLIVFLLFFGIHFLLELSGFNEIEETGGTRKMKKNLDKAESSIVGRGFVFLVVMLMLAFTLCGWDDPFAPQIHGWGPRPPWRIPGWPGFMFEGLWVALFGALPFVMIVKDRGGHGGEVATEFFKYFIMFYMGHFGLQYSGLYREAGLMGAKLGS